MSLVTINGYKIVVNSRMTTQKIVVVKKSAFTKFFERVVSWNPCNSILLSPDVKMIHEPSNEVFINGDTLIMHPTVFNALKNEDTCTQQFI